MHIKQIKSSFEKKDQSLYGTSKVKDLLGSLYHENSKLDAYTARQQGENIGLFSDPYVVERSSKPHKRYFGLEKFHFEGLGMEVADDPFLQLVNRRRSVRAYDPKYLVSLNELEVVLHHSYGVTRKEAINNKGGYMGYRNVPSAGGLYPLEIYLVLFHTQLKQGLYHYDNLGNNLVLIKEGNHMEAMREMIKAEPYIDVKSACGAILVTGLIERQAIKYGERSYRFMMQECGYVSYLMALLMEHIGLGSCTAGAFIDQDLNNFLEIDGGYETILNPIFFGKKTS
jgi:SagB-type dehydrogenase family enzyme